METAEMRRSTLQRKDREELTEIASTLGKKPPSRARKGEIIDLILDLAAGGDGSAVEMPSDDSENDDDTSAKSSESTTESSSDDSSNDAAEASDGQSRNRDESAESGNRKRRRRGRDRENNRDNNDAWDGEPIPVAGYLELRPEGYGFLRVDGSLPSKDDAYVPVKMVRQFSLRKGDHLAGTSRPANRNEKNPAIIEITTVNGAGPGKATGRPEFDDLVAVYPNERLVLAGEQQPAEPTARVIDLLTPIGKGQRALVASPPKAGKTSTLKHVVRAIETNHPDVELLVLLLDERPEEITDMVQWVERGEVIASGFDRPTDEHITMAEMTLERAKRKVEDGKDVCLVVDGITRLARAYNLEASQNSRGSSGSIDSTSIYPSKRFLGAARNIERGGSLTILATIVVDSGSSIDAAIYEELSGTANLELRLDHRASVRRVFPAVEISRSMTHNEDLLVDDAELEQVRALRRHLAAIDADPETEPVADLQALIERITNTPDNDTLLAVSD